VLIDLTVAIEIGMVLAVFLFMRKMIKFSDVSIMTKDSWENGNEREGIDNYTIPNNVEVFEITGPLFFGAAYKFKDAMKFVERPPKVLIIRMRQVPIIDATGIKAIEEVFKDSRHRGTKLILSEVRSEQVLAELKASRLSFAIGKANITNTFEKALARGNAILKEMGSK